ncbi:MAG: hypothetical protein WC684_06845 [Hyphomicrobium sp.]|jgi:hypothetical protein
MAGELSRYLAKIGAKGGAKSRRVLTPEQAAAMAQARESKRSERAAGAGVGMKARRTKKGKSLNQKETRPGVMN